MKELLARQEQDAAAIEKLTADYRVSLESGVLNPIALYIYMYSLGFSSAQ